MRDRLRTDTWLLAANPDLDLICISKFLGIDTDIPVGIIEVFPGSILICFSIFAERSIPDEPFVSYLGSSIFLDSLLIKTSVIN